MSISCTASTHLRRRIEKAYMSQAQAVKCSGLLASLCPKEPLIRVPMSAACRHQQCQPEGNKPLLLQPSVSLMGFGSADLADVL